MKRIIYLFITFLIVFSFIIPVTAYANEVENMGGITPPPEGEVSDTITEETPTSTIEEETDVNFFTRIYEAFLNNKTEFFTLIGSGVIFVLSLILKKDLGTVAGKIIEGISRVISKTDVSEEKQTVIINGLNEMVDGYNEICEQSTAMKMEISKVSNQVKTDIEGLCVEFKGDMQGYREQIEGVVNSNSELDAKIERLFGVVLNLMEKEITQNAEVMEVLTSVYENNDALPQGIKDYVALKHAENAKIVSEASVLLHTDGGSKTNE